MLAEHFFYGRLEILGIILRFNIRGRRDRQPMKLRPENGPHKLSIHFDTFVDAHVESAQHDGYETVEK